MDGLCVLEGLDGCDGSGRERSYGASVVSCLVDAAARSVVGIAGTGMLGSAVLVSA